MSTAYNIRNRLYQSGSAGRATRVDPGSGGTVIVTPVDRATLECTGAGTRTLQAAADVPLGTRILVVSHTDAVVVNSRTIDDGEAAEFVVGLNSSDAHEWKVAYDSASTLPAAFASPPELAATYTDSDDEDIAAALVALSDALVAGGVIAAGITRAS